MPVLELLFVIVALGSSVATISSLDHASLSPSSTSTATPDSAASTPLHSSGSVVTLASSPTPHVLELRKDDDSSEQADHNSGQLESVDRMTAALSSILPDGSNADNIRVESLSDPTSLVESLSNTDVSDTPEKREPKGGGGGRGSGGGSKPKPCNAVNCSSSAVHTVNAPGSSRAGALMLGVLLMSCFLASVTAFTVTDNESPAEEIGDAPDEIHRNAASKTIT